MSQMESYGIDDIIAPVNSQRGAFGQIWDYIRNTCYALPRDLTAFARYFQLKRKIDRNRRENRTISDVFEEYVQSHPDKICFYYEDEKWTYRQVNEFSNKVANYFAKKDFQKGDVVALFMESRCPEYVATWLGLSKLGVCSALINFNLRREPLIHCVRIAKAKALIYGSELTSAVRDAMEELSFGHDIQFFSYGDHENEASVLSNSITLSLDEVSTEAPPKCDSKITDSCLYIYTSGTTGLPKPAVISHFRYQLMANCIFHMFKMSENDVLYVALPLYHSSGGCIGVGQALVNGETVAIRKKFSASAFWDDCIKYNCTVAVYIGEICRYLLSQPQGPSDKKHSLRMMFGNGLKPQIWQSFMDRFNVGHICEFYGATEGNATLVNFTSQVGSVGFIPRILQSIYPVILIRIDDKTGEPIRDKNGFCIRCRPGEPGEIVGMISGNDPFREFHGYVNKEETKKKIIRDVINKGDSAYSSGDILIMDELGNCYFKDRTGDTFRWKGENVSTAEVEAVVSNIVDFRDCCVFGVEIPGCEGRAGMAAIEDQNGELDVNKLASSMAKSLPAYARPQFIRLISKIDLTGTYKISKVNIAKEGFAPKSDKDRIFYWDKKQGQYERVTPQTYNDIMSSKIKF